MPLNPKIKPKSCKVCGTSFIPKNSLQKVCSTACALVLAKKVTAKKERIQQEKQAKLERKRTRLRKESLKTKPQLTKEAQTAFNAYIRERDKGLPCISCNRSEVEIEQGFKVGGYWDAGHYLSRGAYPELRFNEDNCHRQCKSCNGGSGQHSRKELTVQKAYRINLIEKIGIEAVKALEVWNKPANYTHEELRMIKQRYKAKLKQLKSNKK